MQRKIIKVAIILSIISLFVGLLNSIDLHAADYQLPVPENFDIKTLVSGEYDISYNSSSDEHSINLTWTQSNPEQQVIDNAIIEHGEIIERGYKIYTSTDNQSFNEYPSIVPWGDEEAETITYSISSNGSNPLQTGTVYYVKIKAFYKHSKTVEDETIEYISESPETTTRTFMTQVYARITSLGADAIKVQWDDVKYMNERIDYDIEIAQSNDFAQPKTYIVRQQNIKNEGPVIPVSGDLGGNDQLTLEVRGEDYGIDAGTIYYVRINLKNVSTAIRFVDQSNIATGYTQLIAMISRVSDEWWRIEWNPISEASLGDNQTVMYKIKRGLQNQENPILVTIAETSDKKYTVNVTGEDYFYLVVAEITDQFGVPIPDGISSQRLVATETELPSTPAVPDVKEIIRDFYPDGDIVYNFRDATNLNSQSATIAWFVPRSANGEIDSEVVYDISLLSNSEDIDNPSAPKIAENYTVGSDLSSGYITVAGEIVAYKYTFTDLSPNTTYYLKMTAKKRYTVMEDGEIVQQYFSSDPSLKAIVTPMGERIDQPRSPARPPFSVKLKEDGKEDVGTQNIWIEWDNEWYEYWDGSNWASVTQEVYEENSDDESYRYFVYDEDITFGVGYTEYTDGMDYESIRTISDQVLDISYATNELNITELSPNTSYVIWIRAYRDSAEMVSEPSNPIVVTTDSLASDIVLRPLAPEFTANNPGDTYIELLWDYKISDNYTYYLKYSSQESFSTAESSETITTDDLELVPMHKVEGLVPDTLYYFWIQADSTGDKEESGLSQWSEAYIVKTLESVPPETPYGFGIKNTTDAILKNSIEFEWLIKDGVSYVLEIDESSSFDSSEEYNAGAVSEYKVEGLLSNHRYFARLYALDQSKNIRSEPTGTVIVTTMQSGEEYDSSVDTDTIIIGPVYEETVSDGFLIHEIIGVNADRAIEKLRERKIPDFTLEMIDMPDGIKNRSAVFSSRLIDGVSNLYGNVIIDTGNFKCIMRPYMFDTEQIENIRLSNSEVQFKIDIISEGIISPYAGQGMKYASVPFEILVYVLVDGDEVAVKYFNYPLKLSFNLGNNAMSDIEQVKVYTINPINNQWEEEETQIINDKLYNNTYATIQINKPLKVAVLKTTDDNSTMQYSDIENSPYKYEIEVITSKYTFDIFKGTQFRPDAYIYAGDAVKIILDLLEYDYGYNYMESAYKAGIILSKDLLVEDRYCTKKEVKIMVDRLYELKSGRTAYDRFFTEADNENATREFFIHELYNVLKGLGEI